MCVSLNIFCEIVPNLCVFLVAHGGLEGGQIKWHGVVVGGARGGSGEALATPRSRECQGWWQEESGGRGGRGGRTDAVAYEIRKEIASRLASFLSD